MRFGVTTDGPVRLIVRVDKQDIRSFLAQTSLCQDHQEQDQANLFYSFHSFTVADQSLPKKLDVQKKCALEIANISDRSMKTVRKSVFQTPSAG